MLGRLLALWLLGSALVVTLVGRLLGALFRRPTGLERFERAYGAEGHHPPGPGAVQLLLAEPGCTSCRQCDVLSRVGEDPSAAPLSALLTGPSRTRGDRRLVSSRAAALRDQLGANMGSVCPFGVRLDVALDRFAGEG